MSLMKRKAGMTLMTIISEDANYKILDESFVCCDEHQFRYWCKVCEDTMDCQFCGFDPYNPHDCEPEI